MATSRPMRAPAPLGKPRLARRHGVCFALLVGLLVSFGQVAAQDSDAQPSALESLEGTEVDPLTGERYRPTRPEEAIRQGTIRAPAWVPITLGGVALAISLAAIGVWLIRRRR